MPVISRAPADRFAQAHDAPTPDSSSSPAPSGAPPQDTAPGHALRAGVPALSITAAAVLAACGDVGGLLSGVPPASGTAAESGASGASTSASTGGTNPPTSAAAAAPAPAAPPLVPKSDQEAARFLQQAQFTSLDSELADLRTGSYAAWLKRQYDRPVSSTLWDWVEARGWGVIDPKRYFFDPGRVADFALWRQLFTAPDQMRLRATLALSEFFVVSLESPPNTWAAQFHVAWWDMLAGHAFGNFRTLLNDVTLSPAMGAYLNTKGNQKADLATGRVPDENYAREVMQLFTIGLNRLNPDGTEVRDGTGKPIQVYTQSDVSNLAMVFTGYDHDASVGTFRPPKADGSGLESYSLPNKDIARRPMTFDASKHSPEAKTFLGTRIAANVPGAAALKTALDALFMHPNTAPFFCKQMIQRLVTSNPTPAYVGRVAAAFVDNGAGVRGDLRAVWSAILLDPEARSEASAAAPGFGKLREPMVRYIQWGRSFGFNSLSGGWKMIDLSDSRNPLGQRPLRSPSVFNFFRPGYVPPKTDIAAASAVAPEFQIVNETTVADYLNFMQAMINEGGRAPRPAAGLDLGSANFDLDIVATYASEMPLVTNAAALVARLNLVLCAGRLSPATVSVMVTALDATPVTAGSSTTLKQNRVKAAVLMVMGCAEYIVQK